MTQSSLFPVAMKIQARTIALDLVEVNLMESSNTNNHDEISREVTTINRDNKIDSIINDVEYKEMKVEDHPEYKSGIFYIEYKYGSSTHSKI